MKPSVIVVIKAVVFRKGKVLLLKRSSTEEVGAGQWDTAGGKLEFGEELEAALVREVKEEAGIEAQVKRLLYASTFLTDPSRQLYMGNASASGDAAAGFYFRRLEPASSDVARRMELLDRGDQFAEHYNLYG